MTPSVIILDSEERRARAIKVLSLLNIERPLEVSIKPHVERRTLKQNARLHKLFSLIADHIGDDIESVKLAYKVKFLVGKEKKLHGVRFTIYPETSKMNKKELNEFMEKVEAHAITELAIWLG